MQKLLTIYLDNSAYGKGKMMNDLLGRQFLRNGRDMTALEAGLRQFLGARLP